MEVVAQPDAEAVAEEAAKRFAKVVRKVAKRGGVSGDGIARIVLTGGGPGIAMLRKLVNHDIDWERVHVFFGDERNVPVTDPESNEGQAREALLEHVDIPEANIHGYGLGGVDLNAAAENYEAVLADFAPDGFDLHLLGMGGEGHINSLFPHTPAVKEKEHLVVAVTDSPKPPAERVTLTLPAVHRAKRVWIVTAGTAKAEAIKAVVDGKKAVDWPAAGATGTKETLLIVDKEAASLL
ncbi:6-phosphogluconolactonase [Corynebacterium sp. SCR221107]|uniref:6-phosphogluconolactonase n=1 Tax=Corynebacterium sp. SCR221107 TaxID=3017361 RepID=UPI0022EC4EC0|nr:6-phosphogluconolactonase [Corynebacterium sp. SCR221107]WBT07752.1 6-phosphogluconolactonase [Corynebacterium sp. SCR221107]